MIVKSKYEGLYILGVIIKRINLMIAQPPILRYKILCHNETLNYFSQGNKYNKKIILYKLL